MSNRVWSKYQEAIFDAYENTKSNLFINATAGSGKTSTMLECLKRTSPAKKKQFLAFNKSISAELSQKVPAGVDVNTFHSKSIFIFYQNFSIKPSINENKCFGICQECLDLQEIPFNKRLKYSFDLQNIWNQLRSSLLEINITNIVSICIELNIEVDERMVDDIKIIKNEWIKRAKNLSSKKYEIDFCDMLYLTYLLVNPENYPKYDVVFTDECQDLNYIQKDLVLKLLKPKGRFVVVGDFSQQIYGFQGSSTEVFSSFKEIENTLCLPLSISYRCGKNIVEEARKVFPEHIEASPTAIDGIVRHGSLSEASSGDFVLCRNNLPLIEAFIYFLEDKKQATIKGKDLGASLISLLDNISKIEDLEYLLDAKIQKIMNKSKLSKQSAAKTDEYLALEERCLILATLYSTYPSIPELTAAIGSIFSEEIKGIVLCTCHKSKGLEADRVFFLNPELIPSPRATTEKAKYGEKCLQFVAITRAKKELIYCKI